MSNAGVLTRMRGDIYNQFGKQVLVTQVRFSTLEAIFEIDHEVQRQLDPARRVEIRKFIIDAIEDEEYFSFSPFIFSSRQNIREVEGGFELEPGSKMFVIDGQHRTSALSSGLRLLKMEREAAEESSDYAKAEKLHRQINKLINYPVSLQIYLDLTMEEERQLFSDTNTERREAHNGLKLRYDYRDKYSQLTREVAHRLEDKLDIETEASRLTKYNTSITSLTVMRKCLIALFEGGLTVKKGDPYFRNCRPAEVPVIAGDFFESWLRLFPPRMADRSKYVVGLTGIQIALAYTVYLLTKEHGIKHKEAIDILHLLKKQCTWKHDDPLFKHMYNPATGRIRSHSTTTAIKKTSMKFLRAIHAERSK